MRPVLLLGALLAPALALRLALWLVLVLQVIVVLRGLVKHRPAQPRGLADPPEMWFEQVPVQSLKINVQCLIFDVQWSP